MANQKDISPAHFSNLTPVMKSTQAVANATYAESQNIATLETYLLANGYTQAVLDKMTKADKIYAYRSKKGAAVSPLP